MGHLKNLLLRLIPFVPWAFMVLLVQTEPQFLQVLRLKVFDLYQQTWELPQPENPPVYVIDVDEKSLAELGQWPWPRVVIADLVESAFDQGVSALAFDMIFAEPDRTSPSIAPNYWEISKDQQQKLKQLEDHDKVFADTLAERNVVLGFAFTNDEVEARQTDFWPYVGISFKQNIKPYLPVAANVIRNLQTIEDNAPSIGWFSYQPDPDNIIRRVPTVMVYDGEPFPPLSVELLRLHKGTKALRLLEGAEGVGQMTMGQGKEAISIPTDQNGFYWIRFRKSNPEIYISAVDVLKGNLPEGFLKDKMVVVGTSAKGLLDLRATPLNANMPGVEVHAQVIETVLNGDFLKRPGWAKFAEFLTIFIGGILLIILVEMFGAISAAVTATVAICAVIWSSVWLFVNKGLLLDPIPAVIGLTIIYLFHNILKYSREESSRKAIRGAFSHYLSPEMVRIVARDPDKLKLGGEQKEMTIFFSDIRGFTTISEQFDAEGLSKFINAYLTPMTEIVLKNQGTIDKYIGDAIVAFWNAPVDVPRHPKIACESALEMLKELKKMNKKWQAEGLPEIGVGIGLNTGNVNVGNMGSSQRFDYTVMGDTVNLAARLESGSKLYGVSLVVSQNVVDQVPEGLFLPLDLVTVKGKTEPVKIYELVGMNKAKPEVQEELELATEAVELYRQQKWQASTKLFKQLKHHDTLRDLYLSRIKEYKKNPPPKNWDGSYVATSK